MEAVFSLELWNLSSKNSELSFSCVQGGLAAQKEAVLLALCGRSFKGQTMVFFRTKQAAHRAKIIFGLAGLPPAGELHGDMSQAGRLESLEQFRKVGLERQNCRVRILGPRFEGL